MMHVRSFFSLVLFLIASFAPALMAQEARFEAFPLWREGHMGDADPELNRLTMAFVRLAERVRPAVVQVRVTVKAVAGADGESQQPSNSRGSGFIIHPQGYILTAHHVVDGAREIEVRLADRQRLRGKVVTSEPHVDLAILKVDGTRELPTLPLGDSDTLKVGELAATLGFPFGFESSLSLGTISRRGRNQNISAGFEFIQTDAGASAGSSGGPLIDMRGHVAGMITMASERGTMGFAVPVNIIKQILPRLLRGEKLLWGWLGVSVSEMTLQIADAMGFTPVRGVVVNSVLAGQPAERAGVLPRDVVLSVNEIDVDSPRELTRLIGGIEAGSNVRLTIFRRGETLQIPVRLGIKPESAERREG